jgi:hypothetical protein
MAVHDGCRRSATRVACVTEGSVTMRQILPASILSMALACAMASDARVVATASLHAASEAQDDARRTTRSVSGTAVHFFSTAIVHSQTPTATGMIQRSTDIIELSGDLKGRVLYHPTSVFDFVKGTLVNTGHQVFSGTVLGSAPVLLHDDEFRFEVDLNTGGLESGEVHLSDRIAGPKIRCDLVAVGVGATTPEGNSIVDYSGTCTFKK